MAIKAHVKERMGDVPAVFVINMVKDTERRAAMEARLDTLQLPYAFFPAVDGRAAGGVNSPFYDGPRRRRVFGRDMLPGEIGCLLSHRTIFEKMVEDNIPCAVVLEDDVVFEKDFPDVLRALLSTPVKWDVIRFLGSAKIYKRGCRKIAPLTGRYWLARLPTAPGGAHGYLMTRHAAQVMLKHMRKNWLPIDTLQGRAWETKLETLVVHPAPLWPDNEAGSTIGDARFDKTVRLEGLDKTLYPFRRALYKAGEALGKKYIYWSAWRRDGNGGRYRDPPSRKATADESSRI